jgi:hypothetical protein
MREKFGKAPLLELADYELWVLANDGEFREENAHKPHLVVPCERGETYFRSRQQLRYLIVFPTSQIKLSGRVAHILQRTGS